MKSASTATRKSNARRVLRARRLENQAAARLRRRGAGSLATHCMAAGASRSEAQSIASSLRKAAAKLDLAGTVGRTHAGGRMRDVTRYTPAQVASAAIQYKPRKAAYKLIAARIILKAFGA